MSLYNLIVFHLLVAAAAVIACESLRLLVSVVSYVRAFGWRIEDVLLLPQPAALFGFAAGLLANNMCVTVQAIRLYFIASAADLLLRVAYEGVKRPLDSEADAAANKDVSEQSIALGTSVDVLLQITDRKEESSFPRLVAAAACDARLQPVLTDPQAGYTVR